MDPEGQVDQGRDVEHVGQVEHDGVRIEYEVRGSAGEPTVLLMPTWAIVDRTVWQQQVDALSTHARVVSFDGAGNGGSDRTLDPGAYAHDAVVGQALAVLDAVGAGEVVGVALSAGTGWLLGLAATAPERIRGAIFLATPLPLVPPAPERASIGARFHEPAPDPAKGWDRYNADYWRRDYPDFVEFFFDQCLPEPDSASAHAFCSALAHQTTCEILIADMAADAPDRAGYEGLADQVRCPTVVVHGDADLITPVARGERLAELLDGELMVLEGVGHIPHVRHPERVTRIIEDFLIRVS